MAFFWDIVTFAFGGVCLYQYKTYFFPYSQPSGHSRKLVLGYFLAAVSFSTESHSMAASYTSTFLPSFLPSFLPGYFLVGRSIWIPCYSTKNVLLLLLPTYLSIIHYITKNLFQLTTTSTYYCTCPLLFFDHTTVVHVCAVVL